jgi:hypothetical protein
LAACAAELLFFAAEGDRILFTKPHTFYKTAIVLTPFTPANINKKNNRLAATNRGRDKKYAVFYIGEGLRTALRQVVFIGEREGVCVIFLK